LFLSAFTEVNVGVYKGNKAEKSEKLFALEKMLWFQPTSPNDYDSCVLIPLNSCMVVFLMSCSFHGLAKVVMNASTDVG